MIKRKDAVNKTDKTLRLIRAFEECVECLASNKPFPKSVSYQRSKIYYKIDESCINAQSSSSTSNTSNHDTNIYLFDTPIDDQETYSNTLNNFEYFNSDHVIDIHNIEYLVSNSSIRINNLGKWILITKIKIINNEQNDSKKFKSNVLKRPLWLLKFKFNEDEQPIKLIELSDSRNDKPLGNLNKE